MRKNKNLNITEIEDGIKQIVSNFTISDIEKKSFIEDFLSLYEIPKTSITRAKTKAKEGNDFIIKNKVFYRAVEDDVVLAIDTIEQEMINQKSKPRYIITTNFFDIAAMDTKTRETLNISLAELPANADFFLAWNGIEKADYQGENPADRKAAERFARLYDVIAKDNPAADEHAFNMFLIRTLFLFFSEDTGIIPKSSFTNVLKTRTDENADNMNDVISDLFEILDISQSNRNGKSNWLMEFPYVNGKLFGEKHIPLIFSKESRRLLIEAGELLNWQDINPDILGAMIQSVASAEDRHVSGMHYTSVPNIMKVISPLFLDDLTEEYDRLVKRYEEIDQKNITKLTPTKREQAIIKDIDNLIERISKIKFLDPASGSGNFLIIAYKEIRRLEIKLLLLKQKAILRDFLPISQISLNQFNGIELDDFAHEVARLSLWIAEHQMNEEMVAKIPSSNPALLPLKDAGNIVQGNALRIDWNTVFPHEKDDEVYIMGNPPYIGSKFQTKDQKKDLEFAITPALVPGKLDIIAGWFWKAALFINKTDNEFAFVTTNSISQGEQVQLLWSKLLEIVQIKFAYSSFKWKNSAKGNAGVTVAIIGCSTRNKNVQKKLISADGIENVKNINPYLTDAEDIIVKARTSSVSGFPKLQKGNAAYDNGFLTLSKEEADELISENKNAKKYIKKYISADDFISETYKYCLWIDEENYEEAASIDAIKKRIDSVRNYRSTSKRAITKQKAEVPYAFGEIRYEDKECIIVPVVSSEFRVYVPMGIVGKEYIPSYATFTIYDASMWLLALLESRMHMTWLRAIGGKLKTDYRYSSRLVYNTFPIKNLSTQRKNEMSRVMLEILDLREFEGGTLSELYNNNTMPESLRKKHKELDEIVDRAYRQKPFENDEERLSVLLKLYKEMTND